MIVAPLPALSSNPVETLIAMRRRSFRQASDLPQAQNEAAKQLLFELFPSAISMTEIRQELAKSFEAPAGTTGVQQASQLGMCVCVCVCVCVCAYSYGHGLATQSRSRV